MRMILIMGLSGITVVSVAQQTVQKPRFEAASIKRSNERVINFRFDGDRFVMNGQGLPTAIQFAYGPCDGSSFLANQIVGGPGWMQVDDYDIEAKADSGGKAIPRCEMQQMVQSLLEERFQLKAHFERRELPVFNLVVVKPGKMTLSADQTPLGASVVGLGPRSDPAAPLPRGLIMQNFRGSYESFVTGTAVPMDQIVRRLQGAGSETWDRQIIDKTGLSGLFDIHLHFAPENPTAPTAIDPSGSSLFTALQEQLGLKLEPAKAQLPILVIDSIQRPSEN